MAEKQYIEFVCTANQGRSPVAELIGRNHLKTLDTLESYETASSGINVQDIEDGNLSLEFMMRIVQAAAERGDVYTTKETSTFQHALKTEGSESVVKELYDKAVKKFQEEEHAWKAEALAYLGIEGVVKKEGEQTIPLPNTKAVLTMEDRHAQKVKEIYQSSSYDSIIDVLNRYAGEEKVVVNSFGKKKDDYFEVMALLVNHVPKAIDKLLR